VEIDWDLNTDTWKQVRRPAVAAVLLWLKLSGCCGGGARTEIGPVHQ